MDRSLRISVRYYHRTLTALKEPNYHKYNSIIKIKKIGAPFYKSHTFNTSKFNYSISTSSFIRHCSTNSLDSQPIDFRRITTETNKEVPVASESNPPVINVESTEYIPAPPAPPDPVVPELNAIGEVPFSDIGLGGYSPVGLVQNFLEYLHVSCDLPWLMCISILTVVVRTSIFPLVIKSQRNAVQMTNNLPQLQVLQMKLTEARNTGNNLEAMRISHEMVEFMKTNEISPLKNVVVPLVQAPLFISVFLGLRGCANLPVESMRDAGIFWFPDLTIADPYYLLSVITSATLLATIELGVDGNQAMASKNMKYVFRAIPIIIFPFTVNFPAAILWYWVTTNAFSLAQVGFLKIPAVRNYFKIGIAVKRDPTSLPNYNKKGFVENMKESWRNNKILREIEDRQRVDEVTFKQAGSGPLVKTYKFDPTKSKNIVNVKAKTK